MTVSDERLMKTDAISPLSWEEFAQTCREIWGAKWQQPLMDHFTVKKNVLRSWQIYDFMPSNALACRLVLWRREKRQWQACEVNAALAFHQSASARAASDNNPTRIATSKRL